MISFAIHKTGYANLAHALKGFTIQGEPGSVQSIILHTHLGPEFRLEGEMGRRVIEFMGKKGILDSATLRPETSDAGAA